MSRPEHEKLPPHIRRGIDDQLERIARDEQIGAEALRAAGGGSSLGVVWFTLSALFILLLFTVIMVSLALEHGGATGQEFVIVTTPTTYGAATHVP